MTDNKTSLKPREVNHIAKLIESEVSYFNGWSVTEGQMKNDCMVAAQKIEKYLNRNQRNKEK